MKKIIGLLIIIAFSVAVEHVVQTYDNGMPKVIKVYNSYGKKLSLTKETGYYSDGSKQYEMKYNKGKVISNNRWKADGKKKIGNATWTLAQKEEAQGVLCQGAPSQEACECVMNAISKDLSFDEFKILDNSSGPGDPSVDENLRQRAMALKSSSNLQECISKFPAQRGEKVVPNIKIEDLEKMQKARIGSDKIEIQPTEGSNESGKE